MAKIPRFNVLGFAVQKGIDDIRRACEATITALDNQRLEAERAALESHRAVAADETDAYEYDENGHELYSRERQHQYLVENAASTIPIARGAYVVILHHYWEKSCGKWMQCPIKYDKAYKWPKNQGLRVDGDGLEILRKAANTIKRGSDELFASRPGFLEHPAENTTPKTDFANLSRLHPSRIDRMFEAVRKLGIQIDSGFSPSLIPRSGSTAHTEL